ncbi:glycoside hydrolase family 131 protein [Zasmidium cellare ATCC 36951]|uniref:Glycoside hydrolase family 131 protein n=1 Tax=Zasmidium cellare ATCC 36951 TaxID=1080233 RepID=A0A6A6D684_ZASCE|nr:glycoside hydrolase family 131 protein [Zasmidium cellare ATCC 36951]KAF2173659.1 glycoside hydrolase family 131 protein [Zasmidium cellare ATCC 36951]
MFASAALLALAGTAAAGSILWDGRLNDYETAAFLDDWSWSNQVGPYQYYIHGSGVTSEYVDLAENYKNPADSGSNQGIQISTDKTSSWNGQTMLRTELIPQTTAAINKGKVYYHFSVQHNRTNPPTPTEQHQVCFFESHFTELKFGASGGSSNLLQWYANSQPHWNVNFEAGVWHNVAYGIDFDAQTVEFYHSTGAEDLTLTAGPISAATSSNGADWHLGVLRLPSSTGTSEAAREDWHFSGVYIESGDITKSIAGTGGSGASVSAVAAKAAVTTTTVETATPAQTTFTAPTTLLTQVKAQQSLAKVYTSQPQSETTTSCKEEEATTQIALNLAPTFSPTGSISLTHTAPTTLSTWYAETAIASTLFDTSSSQAMASNPALVFTATDANAEPVATDC